MTTHARAPRADRSPAKTRPGRNAARKTEAPPRTRRPGSATGVRLWIRLTIAGVAEIGPGKIELLRRIRDHRSISAAARAMKMSYRRAWLLVADLNEAFAEPVVEKWMGGTSRGGAVLTPTGEKLVASYETVLQRATDANRDVLELLASLTAKRRTT
jgi:molybdate transport system regulatory protein